MKYEREPQTAYKLASWAENLPDGTDFADYWYNLFLSQTKEKLDGYIGNNIHAFSWNRWKNDFEIYVDKYTPISGDGFNGEIRYWYAYFIQHLIYAFQISSRRIATHYGKEMFTDLEKRWYQYHTLGSSLAISKFTERYGMPAGVARLHETKFW